MWDNGKVIDFALGYCAPHKLLLLSKSGSHLHGTDSPESDHDFKGVFLPDVNFCFLNQAPDEIKYTSGANNSKNSKDDVDIDLWSVQKWCRLLKSGDSNALSLLFSTLNSNMILYADNSMVDFMKEYTSFYDYRNVDSLIGFSTSQLYRYIEKGDRLKLLEDLIDFFKEFPPNNKLESIKIDFSEFDPKGKYLDLEVDEDGRTFFVVMTKKYMTSIRNEELIDRLSKEASKYGARTKSTQSLDGNDWKAIAHAVRSYYEAVEMLSKGYIEYPLVIAEQLKQIKQGRVSLSDIDASCEELKEVVHNLKNATNHLPTQYSEQSVFSSIIKLYSMYSYNTE